MMEKHCLCLRPDVLLVCASQSGVDHCMSMLMSVSLLLFYTWLIMVQKYFQSGKLSI